MRQWQKQSIKGTRVISASKIISFLMPISTCISDVLSIIIQTSTLGIPIGYCCILCNHKLPTSAVSLYLGPAGRVMWQRTAIHVHVPKLLTSAIWLIIKLNFAKQPLHPLSVCTCTHTHTHTHTYTHTRIRLAQFTIMKYTLLKSILRVFSVILNATTPDVSIEN